MNPSSKTRRTVEEESRPSSWAPKSGGDIAPGFSISTKARCGSRVTRSGCRAVPELARKRPAWESSSASRLSLAAPLRAEVLHLFPQEAHQQAVELAAGEALHLGQRLGGGADGGVGTVQGHVDVGL